MISIEESFPAYSSDGLGARDILFFQFNDVNFYVEDEGQENLYHEILRRLFPEIKIGQIFPLGGKENVWRHARDPENTYAQYRSIYLVDMDFDDLLGRIAPEVNIFPLDRFCIENYLLEPEAIVQIAVEAEPKTPREELRGRLDFESFIDHSWRSLGELFRSYFVVQRLELPFKNCDFDVERFSHEQARWEIDANKVVGYRTAVERYCIENNLQNELRQALDEIFPAALVTEWRISGKYLLKLAYHYLRSKVPLGNNSIDSLMYRLSCNCELQSLAEVEQRIRNFLNGVLQQQAS